MRLHHASESLVAAVARKLSPELREHFLETIWTDVSPPTLPALFELVRSNYECSTTIFLRDGLSQEKYDAIQRLSPQLLQELAVLKETQWSGPATGVHET